MVHATASTSTGGPLAVRWQSAGNFIRGIFQNPKVWLSRNLEERATWLRRSDTYQFAEMRDVSNVARDFPSF